MVWRCSPAVLCAKSGNSSQPDSSNGLLHGSALFASVAIVLRFKEDPWCWPSPMQVDPLLLKGANLMELAGNETRLQELQRLRERKLAPSPGPGAYELSVSLQCLQAASHLGQC